MSAPQGINRKMAEELFTRFAPMFEDFEARGIDYCLVGGLAVVAQCLARGADRFRATTDADAMVPADYSNHDFARDYLRVYAADPRHAKSIYEAVFGEDGFSRLSDEESSFVNVSFVGADADLDGVDTPDFDVCRVLNGRTLTSIERERLVVVGHPIWIATVDELLGMKRETILIYGNDVLTSPRPQDYVDVDILSSLTDNSGVGEPRPSSGDFMNRLRQVFGRQ